MAEPPARKPFPFHPPLFAAFPILSIYSANLALIPLSDLWIPLAVSILISLLVWGVCALLARSLSRGASAASLICGTAVLFAPMSRSVPLLQTTWVWLVCVGVLAILLASFVVNPYFLNLIGALLVGSAVGGIVLGEVRARSDLRTVEYQTPSATIQSAGRPPDIFYMILDGYGRQDMLKRVMNFDNSAFIDGLKKRGFYVADKSRSNYVQTEISLSSSLNFDLIPKLLPKIRRNTTDRSVFDALISNNAASRFLRDRGYRTISVTSGFPPLKFPHSDLWLTQAANTTLFETTLLEMTPFVNQDVQSESMFVWHRSAILGALENVRNLAEESTRPRFVFVHILAPHPPFVFGPHGEPVHQHGPYGYWDGSDYMSYVGNRAEYMRGYTDQVQYLNTQVLKTLDALLASKQRPIILVQGDHGSKSRLDQDDLRKTDVTECFENLSAYYVPDEIRNKLYPSITPVNSFRILLSTLFGAKLPPLPDRSWYSPFSTPLEFTDVTDKVVGSP